MRYETIVEITPDGRPALRLVIVPDEPRRKPTPAVEDSKRVIIIPPPSEEEDPFAVNWEV